MRISSIGKPTFSTSEHFNLGKYRGRGRVGLIRLSIFNA